MKARGNFLVRLYRPDETKYHPEGEWVAFGVTLRREGPEDNWAYAGTDEVLAQNDPEKTKAEMDARLVFGSHTGKTGGDLIGRFVEAGLFEGYGTVWGTGACGWQKGSLFAPQTHTARVWALSPQTYEGSLTGMAGRPIQEAKRAYDDLLEAKAAASAAAG